MIATGALAQDRPATAPSGDQADAAPPREIIVTGSRISLRGLEAPTPTRVVTADAINLRALPSVGEFLNQMPSFRNSQDPQSSTSSTLGTGQYSPDLRGLGVKRTLTLVDGQRFVPSSVTGQVDLNLIPQALIDRVDVVTGGASAAYGSDAVAGVVNIILNNRLQGFKGDVSSGISSRGDDQEYRASLAFGTNFAGDRGHFVIGGDYFNSVGILDTFARPAFAEQPGLITYTGTRAAGVPSRAYVSGITAVNMAYGGVIIGANAGVGQPLRGIQFVPGGTAAFNYGNYANYGSASTLASNYTGGDARLFAQNGFPIVLPTSREVAAAHLDFDVSSTLSLFAEGNYGESGANGHSPPVRDSATSGAAALTILQGNAYLPASVRSILEANNIASFTLGRFDSDFGSVNTNNKNTTARFVGGFSQAFGHNWKLSGYYEYGRNVLNGYVSNLRIEQNFRYATDAVQLANGSIVCAASQPTGTVTTTGRVLTNAAGAAGCTPINLFGAGSPSAAALAYVNGTLHQRTETEQQVGSLQMQGELAQLPGGPLAIAFGGEWRQEKANQTVDPISQAGGFNYSNPKAFGGSYTVKEGFGEINAPLFKGVPLVDLLAFNAAVRYTDYSTSGGVTTWKAGLIYQPIPDIRFRVNRSRDIRAPNNSELYGYSQTFATVTNPYSLVTGQTLVINRASATLRPEKANTWTIGTVLTPRFIPGLSFSADYYDIKINGAIASFSPQDILNNCSTGSAYFCQFVSLSGSGTATTINQVSVQLLNIGSIRERGVDFEMNYRTRFGSDELTLHGAATYVKDLIFDDGQGNPVTFNAAGVVQSLGSVINRAGVVGGFTSGQQTDATDTPHLMAQANTVLKHEALTFIVGGRYVGGGRLEAALVGPGDKYYNPASPISIADNRVSGRAYLDLGIQVDVIKEVRRRLQFYANVDNVTDSQPPFPVVDIVGLYDRVGRYFRTGLRFVY